MRELTMCELDGQLAEQLPTRELMGTYKAKQKPPDGGDQNAYARGGDGGQNTSFLSPQINLVNVAIGGDATQANNQSADGGGAIAINARY
jgi:hypothetical protein